MSGPADIQIAFSPALSDLIDDYFVSLGQGVNAAALIRERQDLLRWMNALSDPELDALGLTRDRIPARVFADLFG